MHLHVLFREGYAMEQERTIGDNYVLIKEKTGSRALPPHVLKKHCWINFKN
jgi:hypothetical protein